MKNPPRFDIQEGKSSKFNFVKNPYFYVFLRLTTRICCQIAVSCQLSDPKTLENKAFYLPMLFNVGISTAAILYLTVTCYKLLLAGSLKSPIFHNLL